MYSNVSAALFYPVAYRYTDSCSAVLTIVAIEINKNNAHKMQNFQTKYRIPRKLKQFFI